MNYPIITYSLTSEQICPTQDEILHYLGYTRPQVTEEDRELIDRFRPMVQPVLAGRGCYSRYPIECVGDGRIRMPYGEIFSKDLTANLHDCSEIYLMAVTIGAPFDRLLQRTRLSSMAEVAVFQAIGAASVEYVIDSLNAKLRQEAEAEGYFVRPRYSPGFGDYTLEHQKRIFELLQPGRYAGITLRDTLIMTPEKSVTALMGIGKNNQ